MYAIKKGLLVSVLTAKIEVCRNINSFCNRNAFSTLIGHFTPLIAIFEKLEIKLTPKKKLVQFPKRRAIKIIALVSLSIQMFSL